MDCVGIAGRTHQPPTRTRLPLLSSEVGRLPPSNYRHRQQHRHRLTSDIPPPSRLKRGSPRRSRPTGELVTEAGTPDVPTLDRSPLRIDARARTCPRKRRALRGHSTRRDATGSARQGRRRPTASRRAPTDQGGLSVPSPRRSRHGNRRRRNRADRSRKSTWRPRPPAVAARRLPLPATPLRPYGTSPREKFAGRRAASSIGRTPLARGSTEVSVAAETRWTSPCTDRLASGSSSLFLTQRSRADRFGRRSSP